MRVPARLGGLTDLMIVLLAGLGLASTWDHRARRFKTTADFASRVGRSSADSCARGSSSCRSLDGCRSHRDRRSWSRRERGGKVVGDPASGPRDGVPGRERLHRPGGGQRAPALRGGDVLVDVALEATGQRQLRVHSPRPTAISSSALSARSSAWTARPRPGSATSMPTPSGSCSSSGYVISSFTATNTGKLTGPQWHLNWRRLLKMVARSGR